MSSGAVAMFIETHEYGRFREFCDACRRDRYIGLCYGTAGVGKTLSARYYTDPKKLLPPLSWPSEGELERGLDNQVVLYTPPVVNSPGRIAWDLGRCRSSVSTTLLGLLRVEEKQKLRELEESMEVKWFEAYRNGGVDAGTEQAAEYSRQRDAYYAEWRQYQSQRREIRDVPLLVVIDEADRLKMASLEQVRAIFDEGGMGLVLIGMPGLEKRLARLRAVLFARRLRARIPTPGGEGSRGLLSQGWRPPGVVLPSNWVSDEEALVAILRITDGNFRLLERLLTQIAHALGNQ